MTTDVHDSLARAAGIGAGHFDPRGAHAVVDVVARRVRRHRAMVSGVSALGIVAVVGGAMWGVDALTRVEQQAISPAASPDAAATLPPAVDAWTVSDLIAVAGPRVKGEERKLSTPAMVCADDAAAGSGDGAVVLADCSPVWLKGSAAYLNTYESSVSTGLTGAGASLTFRYALRNNQSWALSVDIDSLFMWVETDPGADTGDVWEASGALVGPTMWEGAGTVVALLDPRTASTRIEPGDSYSGSITATTVDEGDALYRAVTSGAPLRVTLWGRVHEDGHGAGKSVLVQLGDAYELPGMATS